MLAGTLPSNGGRVRSEGDGLATTRPRTTTTTTVSFDAYRSTVGGSITIAVTGTDNPVPTQSDRNTPPSAPVVPASSATATAPADSATITKETQPKP
ncbi:MAG TPA: hypothetical protein VFO66_01090 [Gemmatimonadaceae bacterium]|nr:hypothetical protein [Gemmatimonadaceae bacterium]